MSYTRQHRRVKHVHIFADNTAAVTSAYEPKPTPGQQQMISITHSVDKYLEESDERTISIEWCPGHEDVEGNEQADAEAKKGAEIQTQDYVMMTNAKRRAKERALEGWRNEWQKTPPTGGFAVANRLPPRWKLREHVTDTPREVFGRMTQCRTKHTFIGEYYAKFVPNKKTDCPCGIQLQMREHIIQECLKYEEHQHILQEVDKNLELGILLGTEEGLKALARFLKKSGAFTKTGTTHCQKVNPTEDNKENREEEERWWERMERNEEEDFRLIQEETEEREAEEAWEE
ncbi:hypothetical protein J132_08010 [Termitomyces sp. J132]|nr:hypothetical protein J132_08010 [Termitomyces sp. J132]